MPLLRKDLEDADLILKKIEPKFLDFINMKIQIWKVLNNVKKLKFGGERNIEHYVQVGLPESYHLAEEWELYPEPGESKYMKFETRLTKGVGRLVWSTEIELYGLGDESGRQIGVKDIIKREMESLKKAMELDEACYAWGDGSGEFGQASGVVTGNVIPLVSTANFRIGQRLTAVDSVTGTIIEKGIKVTGVSAKSKEIEVDPQSITTEKRALIDAATKFYKDGTISNKRKAPIGLKGHISDANPPVPENNYQGHDRATNPYMCAVVHYNPASPGTNADWQIERSEDLYNDMDSSLVGMEPELGLVSPGVFQHMCGYLRSKNQPTETIPSKAGTPAHINVVIGGKEIPHYPMKRATRNQIDYMNKEALVRYLGKSNWDRTESGTIKQKLQDRPGFQAVYHIFRDMYTKYPQGLGCIKDVNEGWFTP